MTYISTISYLKRGSGKHFNKVAKIKNTYFTYFKFMNHSYIVLDSI